MKHMALELLDRIGGFDNCVESYMQIACLAACAEMKHRDWLACYEDIKP